LAGFEAISFGRFSPDPRGACLRQFLVECINELGGQVHGQPLYMTPGDGKPLRGSGWAWHGLAVPFSLDGRKGPLPDRFIVVVELFRPPSAGPRLDRIGSEPETRRSKKRRPSSSLQRMTCAPAMNNPLFRAHPYWEEGRLRSALVGARRTPLVLTVAPVADSSPNDRTCTLHGARQVVDLPPRVRLGGRLLGFARSTKDPASRLDSKDVLNNPPSLKARPFQ